MSTVKCITIQECKEVTSAVFRGSNGVTTIKITCDKGQFTVGKEYDIAYILSRKT